MKLWKKGDKKLQPLPKFTAEPGFNFIILESVTLETNKYASEYLQKNKDTLKEHSDFKKWPENGVSKDKMTLFITLTFYFGIVKECHLYNVVHAMSFLHCCESSDYP